MKTLIILIVVSFMAFYVNAVVLDRNLPTEEEEPQCDPATQYGVGRGQERCRCSVQGKYGCLQCNLCSCMGSRGMWRCTRMACGYGDPNLPWAPVTFVDQRGNERVRCMQIEPMN